MANEFERGTVIQGRTAAAEQIDEGLRAYMLRVYNYMTTGLALTGIVAWLVASTPALLQLFYAPTPQGGFQPTILAWIAMLSPLAFVMVLSFGVHRMKASTAQLLFWLFAGVMGLSMAHIFITFTGASIARVFFITAATFAAMSLYGYTTKRDLSGWGTFLFMGLIGIIIASIVNIFIGSSMIQFVVSVIGVLVFVGLTAYDTQRIKEMYNELDNSEVAGKKAIMGALSLYLNFINLFMMLLHLFGQRE
ncbi:MAG: Bax inhibitor-1/YccA family protein [Alphaproteobacteria bacterium]|nr:Bax inhibitor-1/YccA family protein [Alphaproteobacteria bacterium]